MHYSCHIRKANRKLTNIYPHGYYKWLTFLCLLLPQEGAITILGGPFLVSPDSTCVIVTFLFNVLFLIFQPRHMLLFCSNVLSVICFSYRDPQEGAMMILRGPFPVTVPASTCSQISQT